MKNKPILIAALLLLAGCYPGGADFAEDTDVVYTNYDETYDFASKGTFAMPDEIVVDAEVEDGDVTIEYMPDIFADPLLEQIESNMEALGYTRVDIEDNPDLLLTPAGIKSTTFFYSYWYDWWYGCYYGCGWGWYYPPYYTVSSYTTGTLLMVLTDPSQGEDSPINQSKVLWLGAANGIMSGAYDVNRATKAIDQAFKQSPYLQTN